MATLGAELVGGPGPPATPARRTQYWIHPAGGGHPGPRARSSPGPPATPARRTQYRIHPAGSGHPGRRARRRPGATSYTGPPDAAPDHPRRRRPPWAPSSSAARGHLQYRPAGRRTGSPPPAVATLGAELVGGPGPPWAPSSSAARGHLLHRPAGRSTGSPPPAVATLGAELVGGPGPPATPARRTQYRIHPAGGGHPGPELVGGPGPPATPARRTQHRITPAGSGHPGRRARRRPGATSYTGRGERHRSLGSQIGMYTDKNRHHSPWVHWNLPTRAHQNNCHPPWNEVLASWHRRAAPLF